jgi:hypothetical protein
MTKGARFIRGLLVAAPISAACWATIIIPIIAVS